VRIWREVSIALGSGKGFVTEQGLDVVPVGVGHSAPGVACASRGPKSGHPLLRLHPGHGIERPARPPGLAVSGPE